MVSACCRAGWRGRDVKQKREKEREKIGCVGRTTLTGLGALSISGISPYQLIRAGTISHDFCLRHQCIYNPQLDICSTPAHYNYNSSKMATRRGVGLGAFTNRTQTSQSYATHGANLRSEHLTSLRTQLSVFQSLLHTFALEHSATIRSDPTFRAEFARMCNTIGVDPLAASNVKGKGKTRAGDGGGSFWTQILGGDMNDFYFEVAVRVVELCRETRSENGGLIGVEECRKRVGLGKAIGSGLEVTEYPPDPAYWPYIRLISA